jgi:hypothetical protein
MFTSDILSNKYLQFVSYATGEADRYTKYKENNTRKGKVVIRLYLDDDDDHNDDHDNNE